MGLWLLITLISLHRSLTNLRCFFVRGVQSWKTERISRKVADWKNSQTFLEFIEYRLVECYPTGRFVLVLDNVLYHKSAAVLTALSLFEHRLLVIWPPYCPELNLIERYWKHLKDLDG
jgi:transposase